MQLQGALDKQSPRSKSLLSTAAVGRLLSASSVFPAQGRTPAQRTDPDALLAAFAKD